MLNDEEAQRMLDNTFIGARRRLNEQARELLRVMLREWRTFVCVALIVLPVALILFPNR